MIVIPWQPALTRSQLDELVSPSDAQQPEVIPWQLYDTASIATSAAGPFALFTALNADKTLCNMEGPGQLPDPQYFVVHYIACDFLVAPVATALAGEPNAALADVAKILWTCRATVEVNFGNKRYGPFSLTLCHATGGPTFSGYGYGTAANGTSAGIVNNGIPGSGGFPVGGALIIPAKMGFDVTIRLGAAATLSATRQVRMSLIGALYRKVL
jgi:hypothetical protein